MSQPAVAGVSVYALHTPRAKNGRCEVGELGGERGGDIGCIIRDAYVAADGYLGIWPKASN